MEPEATPPALVAPATPDDPVLVPIVASVTGIMDRAYLEMISRKEPAVFMKFATAVLGMRLNRNGDRQQTIVNVVNAIPRSPLDGLPPGFTIK